MKCVIRETLLVIAFTLCVGAFVFSQDVNTTLENAKQAYSKGDYVLALENLAKAKERIENEMAKKNVSTYIELQNWNVVKLSPSKYQGKKVKVAGYYGGISSSGLVMISEIGFCTYIDSMIEKLGSLPTYKTYTWYGEVFIDPIWGPVIRIEKVE